jgi:predicted ester cyclase
MQNVVAWLLLSFAFLSSAFAQAPMPAAEPALTQQERNKAIARRFFDEIFNQGKFQVFDEICAPNFVNHGLHRNSSLQEDQSAARQEKQLVPDLHMTVDMIIAEDDLVTVLWTARGTNTGGAGAFPPTGAKIEVRGTTIWRIADGKIREEWSSFDMLRVVRQVLSQLKWLLIGFFCALVFLLWVIARFIRKLFRTHTLRTAATA